MPRHSTIEPASASEAALRLSGGSVALARDVLSWDPGPLPGSRTRRNRLMFRKAANITPHRGDPDDPKGLIGPRQDLGGQLSTGHVGLCVRDLDRSVRF